MNTSETGKEKKTKPNANAFLVHSSNFYTAALHLGLTSRRGKKTKTDEQNGLIAIFSINSE